MAWEAPPMPTLLRFFDDVYRPAKLPASKWKTIETFRSCLRSLDRMMGRPVSIDELSDRLVAELCEWMTSAGKSRDTAICCLRHILPVWRFACEKLPPKERPPTPTVKLPKPMRRAPKALSLEEMGRIIAAARNTSGMVGDVPARLWWVAFFKFLYYVGARKETVLKLETVRDFSRERMTVTLRAELQKQLCDQVLPIPPRLAEALEPIWDEERRYMFAWPYDNYPKATYTCLNKHIRRTFREARVDTSRGLSKAFRKSCATYCEIVEPGSGTLQLGHHSRAVTLGHYYDPSLAPASQVAMKLPDLTEPPPTLRLMQG